MSYLVVAVVLDCPVGRWGLNCSNICQCEHHECDNVIGCMSCTGHPGWTGANCDEDINECLSQSYCSEHSDCENINGSAICHCHSWYNMVNNQCECKYWNIYIIVIIISFMFILDNKGPYRHKCRRKQDKGRNVQRGTMKHGRKQGHSDPDNFKKIVWTSCRTSSFKDTSVIKLDEYLISFSGHMNQVAKTNPSSNVEASLKIPRSVFRCGWLTELLSSNFSKVTFLIKFSQRFDQHFHEDPIGSSSMKLPSPKQKDRKPDKCQIKHNLLVGVTYKPNMCSRCILTILLCLGKQSESDLNKCILILIERLENSRHSMLVLRNTLRTSHKTSSLLLTNISLKRNKFHTVSKQCRLSMIHQDRWQFVGSVCVHTILYVISSAWQSHYG